MKIDDILKRVKAVTVQKSSSDRLVISERDKKLLTFGLLFVLFVVVFLAYQSYSKKISIYEKQVKILREQLAEVKALSKDYKESKKHLDAITSSLKKEEEALISVMENILIESGVKKENFSIRDSGGGKSKGEGFYEATSVEVEIRRVPLPIMIDILYKIQSRKSFLKVSGLRMRTKFDNPAFLDASFKLSTFEFDKTI